MRRLVLASGALALCTFGVAPRAQGPSEATVIRARTIYTVTQGTIQGGEILVSGGRIQAVGARVQAPAGARVLTADSVMPGMIDSHTHLALTGMRGGQGPITAEWKAVEHVNLDDPMLQSALKGGVTSLITRSGSGIVSSGQAVALKMKRHPVVFKPYVDLKMAVRPLINLRPGDAPATLMGWYPIADEQFRKARIYLQEQQDFAAGRIAAAPAPDARLEAFAAVLRGDVMVHTHTHYPSENQMVMHLAKKYGFIDRLAFAHAEEVTPMAKVLTGTKIIPVIGPMMITRYFGDDVSHNIVKELMEAGVSAAIQTDNSRQIFKDFREIGAFLVRHGLKEEHALQALTINGAKAMMLDKRVGSIEVGKDADLLLLDGHPFDLSADRIQQVMVDGVVEYERPAPAWPVSAPTAVGPFTDYRGQLPAGATRFALTNAHLFPGNGPAIRNATLVVENGRFSSVAAGGAVPGGIPSVDLGGRVVTPGWVIARAFPNDWIGDLKWQVQNDEALAAVEPEMNARFAVDPWFPSYDVNREIGIVSQHITPGHKALIGGSGVLVKSVGMDVDRMIRREPTAMVFSVTQESARRWSGREATPADAARMIRQALDEAKAYAPVPETDRRFDARKHALGPVLRGEVPAIIHARTEVEIRQALSLAADYRLRLIVSGGTESYKLAADLARAGAGVILGNSEVYTSDLRGDGEGYRYDTPAVLTRAGVKVAFFGEGASRRAMPTGRLAGEPALNAAWAYRNGAPELDALRMVSANAAEMLGVADRVGTIAPGKDADFLVHAGHPFDYRALPELVFIDGEKVHGNLPGAASRPRAALMLQGAPGWAAVAVLFTLTAAAVLVVRGSRRRTIRPVSGAREEGSWAIS